ncbi:hypothetical protein R3P38DRAFT_2780614 [Favolaschia claudopus]|uniref:F-box domain-containing protein n=1 Tax=Favolaschia claudopus TaxID=2862362 RepID=A0AAW0B9M2_9AGAR
MSEPTSMSNFLALPEELQVEILLRAAFRADEPMQSPRSKADLMKVCRSWNALVLSVREHHSFTARPVLYSPGTICKAGFWSTIVVHTEMDAQAISLAVAQALTWEQSLRLLVDIEWSASPLETRWTPEKDWDVVHAWCTSMLLPLKSIADRIAILDVRAFDQLRTSLVLESIGLELATDLTCCRLNADCQSMFGWGASMPVCNENMALKQLTCSRVSPTWKTPFVYSSLTRLSLVELQGELSCDDFKAIVACAKLLEYLELSRTLLSQEDPGSPVVGFVARKVRAFTLGVDWGPASYVPAGLQLPALETFTLRAPNGQLGGDVVELCIDYLQSASAFVVECDEPDEDWLRRCALALQHTQCIDVRTVSCTLLEPWVETCAAMPLLRAVLVPAETTAALEAVLREACPHVAIYVPIWSTDYFKDATVSGSQQIRYLPKTLQSYYLVVDGSVSGFFRIWGDVMIDSCFKPLLSNIISFATFMCIWALLLSTDKARRVHLHFRHAPNTPHTTVADVDFRSVWHNSTGSFNLEKMVDTVRDFPADSPRPLDSAFTMLFVDQAASSGVPVNEHVALFLPEEEEVWFGNILVFKHVRGADTPLASVRSADACLARMVALQ